MEYVIPSTDEHWQVQEREQEEEDNVQVEGGYAVAYAGRRDPRAVYLQYEARTDGGWYGFISWVNDDPSMEVWQLAYGLYDDSAEPELTEHYNEVVSPLSDDQFLIELAAYESGALDFVGSLEDMAPTLMSENGIWCGEIPVSTGEDARRYLENTFTALSVDL